MLFKIRHVPSVENVEIEFSVNFCLVFLISQWKGDGKKSKRKKKVQRKPTKKRAIQESSSESEEETTAKDSEPEEGLHTPVLNHTFPGARSVFPIQSYSLLWTQLLHVLSIVSNFCPAPRCPH